MSDQKTIDERLALPVLDLIELARKEVAALNHGKRWRMQIPVDVDDSDLAIGGALTAARKEIERLRGLSAARGGAPTNGEQIYEALRSYRSNQWRDAEGEPMELVDMLGPDTPSIEPARRELLALADHIAVECGGGAPAVPSEAAIQAAADASGFVNEDDPADEMLLLGVRKMLVAAYAVDGAGARETDRSKAGGTPSWRISDAAIDAASRATARLSPDAGFPVMFRTAVDAAYAVDFGSLAPAPSGPTSEEFAKMLCETSMGTHVWDKEEDHAPRKLGVPPCDRCIALAARLAMRGVVWPVARLAVPGEGTKT